MSINRLATMIVYRHTMAEPRLLYIVHECARAGVYFAHTKPLTACDRQP